MNGLRAMRFTLIGVQMNTLWIPNEFEFVLCCLLTMALCEDISHHA